MFFVVAKFQKFFFCCFLLCLMFRTHALGVSPTLLMLSPQEPIANLTLTNEHEVAITMQLETVRWQQRNAKDIYTSSDDIIVTPQIFSIPAHGTQTVRLGLEHPLFGKQEQAYRLFAQEVVPKVKMKTKNELRMALRISLPVIIKAASPIQQKLQWKVRSQHNTSLKISAENKGNNVLFINLLQAFSTKKQPLTNSLTTFVYLLPGSKKEWILHTLNDGSVRSIKAAINDHVSFIDVG